MLEFISKNKKRASTKCIVLYTFEYSRADTKELFEHLINYFKDNYQVEFKYGGYYDEKYEDNYGAFSSIYSRFSRQRSDEIVNFSLDTDNLIEKRRTMGVEFNISRPIHITLFFPDWTEFDISDFVNRMLYLFKPVYGFSYSTSSSYWITAYAIGDWQHSKDVLDIERLSRKHIARWQAGCEKTQSGYIRDVYHENIISQKHLTKLINSKSLEQFIKEDNVGSLQIINQELNFWKLDDLQLQKARKYLYGSEIVI